jgi:hypothetical protein
MPAEFKKALRLGSMSVDEALAAVSGYRPEAGRTQPAQRHLSTAARALVGEALPPSCPISLRLR